MTLTEPTVVVLRGIPGSGKSTYAAELQGAHVISTDDFFTDARGRYRFVSRYLKTVHQEILAQVDLSMGLGRPLIVIDKCNLARSAAEGYAARARGYCYSVQVVTFDCDPETCFSRGVHGVPRQTVYEMDATLREAGLTIPGLECTVIRT